MSSRAGERGVGAVSQVHYDVAEFERLQARLAPMWPSMTLRRQPEPRTLIVVSSVSFPVPPQVAPLFPAYEERYLFYVLSLARDPQARVVYVTSQPVLPRMIDYYLNLMGEGDPADLRRRIIPVAVGDGTARPLTAKILERPRLVRRLRALATGTPGHAVLLPFVTTDMEAALAVGIGVPVYGPDPRLVHLGTKTGSRQAFRAAGVPLPRGAEGVESVDDVVEALLSLGDLPDWAIVKLDFSVSGLGNAQVDLRGVTRDRADLRRRVCALQPEDSTLDSEAFFAQLAAGGGIVEERVTGEDVQSPSVQLRASPLGEVEVLSTHDQVLGGPTGQSYLGCRFPATDEYGPTIAALGRRVGGYLASQGVIGRFGIDFVVTRHDGEWRPWALEINLRNGGTTHPALALLGLTDGRYDEGSGHFMSDGVAKHYTATDHLEHESLRSLTPDDVLDVIEEAGLEWDRVSKTGIVFHMLSAVAVGGQLGLTAIADSADAADSLYARARCALLDAAAAS